MNTLQEHIRIVQPAMLSLGLFPMETLQTLDLTFPFLTSRMCITNHVLTRRALSGVHISAMAACGTLVLIGSCYGNRGLTTQLLTSLWGSGWQKDSPATFSVQTWSAPADGLLCLCYESFRLIKLEQASPPRARPILYVIGCLKKRNSDNTSAFLRS